MVMTWPLCLSSFLSSSCVFDVRDQFFTVYIRLYILSSSSDLLFSSVSVSRMTWLFYLIVGKGKIKSSQLANLYNQFEI